MKLDVLARKATAPAVRPAPLLFVHGLFVGSWGWAEHFLDYFANQGYDTYALSLRGHGQSEGRAGLRWTRLSDYVADVEQVVSGLPAVPVLVGHSYGGAIVQKYLETHTALAGVLLASVPPQGLLATAVRLGLRHPWPFLKANLTLSLYPLVSTPELARDLFFMPSMPEDMVRAYQARMSDESFMGFLDMMALNLPKPDRVKTPLLVIGAEDDTSFDRGQVEATARAYHTEPVMFPNMNHGMMLDENWQAVAGCIVNWLTARGL